MTDSQGYNGWKNYETWAVALWLGNDEFTDGAARNIAQGEGAQGLKNMVEEGMPDLGASLYSDLLGAALSEVDWYEIAEHYEEDDEELEPADA